MKLTDLGIRALQPPEKGAIIYADDTIPGFGVRVSEGGTKSFVLTHGARRHRETIGRVGIISLSDARTEAKRRLAEYTLGKTRPQAISWATALAEFLVEIKAKRKPRTHADYKRLLALFRFGDARLTDVSPHDLQKDLDKLSDRPAEHQHAFVVLRVFINWAFQKHYVDRNPMERMKPPHEYVPRERVLTDDELVRVLKAAEQMGGTFGKIVLLLILLGQRRGVIAQLTADMLGDGIITLPKCLTKNSREHTFPIGKLAANLLGDLDQKGPIIFPARSAKPSPFNGWSKSKAKLDQLCGVCPGCKGTDPRALVITEGKGFMCFTQHNGNRSPDETQCRRMKIYQ